MVSCMFNAKSMVLARSRRMQLLGCEAISDLIILSHPVPFLL